MPERIMYMLVIACVLGFVVFAFILYCCIHASNISDLESADDEQEKEVSHKRKEELS